MVACEFDQLRLLVGRPRRRARLERAPRAKAAAGGRIERARDVALEHRALAQALRVGVGDDGSREQRLRIGMLGAAEELCARCELDELAEVHHGDAVAEKLDRSQVVRDEEAAEAHVALEVAQEVEDRCLNRHVERRHGLVRDQHAGLQDQRTCEADTLTLPARQLVGVAIAQLGAEPDRVEDPVDAHAQLASPRDPVQSQGLADDVATAHVRVERRVRVLEHHVQLAAQRPHLAPREVRDVYAAQANLAGRRLRQAHYAVRHRRLTAARFADEPEELAVLQHERHVVDRVHDRSAACNPAAYAILLDEVADLERIRARSSVHSGPGWKQATRWSGRT